MNKVSGIGSLVSFLLILVFSGMAMAQQPPSQKAPENQLFRGKMLMDNRAYGSATAPLDAYSKKDRTGLKGEEAQVLSLVSAVRAGQEGSEQVLKAYADANQGSPYSQLAYRELGNRAFVEKSWERVVHYYTEAGQGGMSQHDVAVQNFKHGYALLSLKEFDQARARFEAATAAEHEYQPAAYYYTAYLQMREGKYDQALSNLSKAERKTYRGYAPLLRANLYYRQGKYDQVLEEARKFKTDSAAGMQGMEDMSLLAGEAHYMKGDFAQAGKNYTLYLTKNRSGLSKGLQYRIGYAHYKSGKFDKAVPSFTAAAQAPDTLNGKRDTLSQMASYYLGASYLQQKNKQFALNAFTQAVKTPGDDAVNEQAMLTTGKLLFELGRYDMALQTMQEYKRRYPDSPQEAEADEVVGESYLNSGNFETALAYIQSVRKKTPRILAAFQRVTYQKGIKLFNDDSTAEAARFFERSLQYPNDAETVTLAHYWAGESYSAEGEWPKAQAQYQNFFSRPGAKQNPFYAKARYGMGYAYFNKKEYARALPQFREFVELSEKQPSKPFYNSGLLRLADCHYTQKDYAKAIQNYDRAIKERNPETDYALYQMALCQSAQGALGEAEQTLIRLNAAYPNSRYRDEASYQRAQLALDQGRYQEAVTQFTDVIRQNPNSTTAPFAYLKRGVAYSNLKQYDKASADYKKILNDYPGNAAAQNAIVGLQESLTSEGKSEEFPDYLAQYKKANPEAGSTEGLEFDAAKSLYFSQKYQKAVAALEGYVKSYPESNLRGEAYFYMGEAFYRLNDRLKAIENHELVVKDGRSSYVTRSLQRLGEMENTGGNYEKSLAYYRRLNTFSRNRKEQINSMVGQMESYFEMGRLDSALVLAEEVLKLPNVTLDAQNKATLYRGKISYANGDTEKATDDFLTTLNTAKDVNGAEAQYLTAEILFKKKEYRQSLNTLYELNKDFSQFQRWKDRAFLLIADNFIAMGETYQATATLNSIIAESPDKKTKDAAKAKLDGLKGSEGKETVE